MAPFKSLAQKAFLKHSEPDVYRRWLAKYGGESDGQVRRLGAKMASKKGKKA